MHTAFPTRPSGCYTEMRYDSLALYERQAPVEQAKAILEYAKGGGFPDANLYGHDGTNTPAGIALDGQIPEGYEALN